MSFKNIDPSRNETTSSARSDRRSSSKTAALVSAARGIGVSSSLRDPVAAEFAPDWLRRSLPAFGRESRLMNAVRYVVRAATLGIVDHNTVRMLLADQEIERTVAAGARQVVILGAGLDSRAHRLEALHECRVFEVDHAASQATKRELAGQVSRKAKSVEYVPVDFESDALAPALFDRGFEPDRPTVWVCEGVTAYLSRSSLERLLFAIGSLSGDRSRLILSYLTPPKSAGKSLATGVPGALVKALGERAIGRIAQDDIANLLRQAGLTPQEDLGWSDWVSQVPGYTHLPNLLKERLVVAECRVLSKSQGRPLTEPLESLPPTERAQRDSIPPRIRPSAPPNNPRSSVRPSAPPSLRSSSSVRPSAPPSLLSSGALRPSAPPSLLSSGVLRPSAPPSLLSSGALRPSAPPSLLASPNQRPSTPPSLIVSPGLRPSAPPPAQPDENSSVGSTNLRPSSPPSLRLSLGPSSSPNVTLPPHSGVKRVIRRAAVTTPSPGMTSADSELFASLMPGTERALVAEQLVHAMEQFGIRVAFGVTGGAFGIIFDRLSRSQKIEVYHCQHEGSAAYAAMGRGMATEGRELAVCFSTAGPGMTNLLTGVAAAFTESVPMLVLTGNSPLRARNAGALQDAHVGGIDAMRMFDPITVANACVERAEDLVPLFYEFAELSLRLRKPVHLNIPIDISNEVVALSMPPAPALGPDPLSATELAALTRFLRARRPLLFVGNGVKLSGLSHWLERVAERHQLPVIVTCHGRGSFREDHACFRGTFGFASDGSGREFLEAYRPDAVLFLGTGLGEMATSGWSRLLAAPTWKVHVDVDNTKFNRSYTMDVCIENDLALALDALATQPSRDADFPPVSRPGWDNVRLLHAPESISLEAAPVHPGLLFESLSHSVPDNALIFAEPGNSMAWAFKHLKLRGTQQLCVPLGLASMGSSIGAAIGAASVEGGRPVICVAGDCATLMNGNELKTAAEHGLTVKVIVLNDGGHGMVQHGSKLVGLENIDVRFEQRVDFTAYARALGFPACNVESQKEWDAFNLESVLARRGPELIEVRIDPAAIPPLADRAKILSLAPSDTAKHDMAPATLRRASA